MAAPCGTYSSYSTDVHMTSDSFPLPKTNNNKEVVVAVIVCYSWIYDYICNQSLSPLTLLVRIPLMAGCNQYNIM
jgi:hypothetical protein